MVDGVGSDGLQWFCDGEMWKKVGISGENSG